MGFCLIAGSTILKWFFCMCKGVFVLYLVQEAGKDLMFDVGFVLFLYRWHKRLKKKSD